MSWKSVGRIASGIAFWLLLAFILWAIVWIPYTIVQLIRSSMAEARERDSKSAFSVWCSIRTAERGMDTR